MTTAYFRNVRTARVHRGFLRLGGAKLFCGTVLVERRDSEDEYRPKGDLGPTFERYDTEAPEGLRCGRCFT